MPIYEYRCRSCGEEFEKLVRLRTREDEVPCKACGEREAERRVSSFSARGLSGGPDRCGPSGFS